MSVRLVLLSCAAALASLLLTWWVRQRAWAQGRLDHPNARSSHSIPTPRGGGLGIVIASLVGLCVLRLWDMIDVRLLLALCGGGLAVSLIGYLDDQRSLPVLLRVSVHFASAIWAVAMLGGVPPLQWGTAIIDPGLVGDVLAVFGIVWMLNLFNFMDGIDGIAGSEAVFVAGAGAAILALSAPSASISPAAVLIGAASLGFLRWNWAPATVFMGDVGSAYLGYTLAVLALGATRYGAAMPYIWLILGGAFFVDATVTLVRRFARRERLYEAHRSHAYQWLARRWGSHARVTTAVSLLNVLWLLPCALLAMVHPSYAGWITLGALTPVALLALLSGAGRPAR
jgi:Fuc2NAc and GlcNAc transferase